MKDAANWRGRGRPRIGVVIGSGGLKCAASIGLWRVLRREGIRPDLFVGCSGGSLFAALMALDRTPEAILERADDMWSHGVPRRLHYPTLLRLLLPRQFRRGRRLGLLNDRHFLATVAHAVDHADFADLGTPLHIMATDFDTGDRVVLSEGSIAEAVRASAAIPGLFRPWPIGGRVLVDGGLADPMPVSVAIQERCDVIIAMGFEQPRQERLTSLVETILQVTSISMNNLLKSSFAFYNVAHHAEIVPILPEFDRRVGLTDTHLVPWLADLGERAAENEMPYLRRLLGVSPVAAR